MEDKLVDELLLDDFVGSDKDELSDSTGRFLYVSYENDSDELILSSHSFIRKEFFDSERRRKEFLDRQSGAVTNL